MKGLARAGARLSPDVPVGRGAATGMGMGAGWGRGLEKTWRALSWLPCSTLLGE